MGLIVTIDTGGTKTRLASFDTVTSIDQALSVEPRYSREFPTPHHPDEYMSMLIDTIVHDFPNFQSYSDENTIVLATTGLTDGVTISSQTIGWNNFPIQSELSRLLAGNRVIIGNDAKVGAVGAFAGSSTKRGLYVTIGTGIGGGMIIDDQLSSDLSGMEIGKLILTEKHEKNTWEALASGSAFYKKYGRLGQDIPDTNPIWQEYAAAIAKGIVAILPVLRPEKIIIGGAMAEFFPKYGDRLEQMVTHNSWQPIAHVKISAVKDFRYVVNRGALIVALQQQDKYASE